MTALADLPLDGLLLVNKPSGPTSYDVIRWIKRSHGRLKVGHCGTLDPLASGLLIILFGKATKKQERLMKQDKVYHCVMRCGIRTDSGDITGRVIEEQHVPSLDFERVQKALKPFLGPQSQIPPMFSALKYKGTPLYKLARRGQQVDRAPRSITIHSISEPILLNDKDIELRIHCSSGTYIRSLVEDIGLKLGTTATLLSLTREKIGPFSIEEALPAESLKTLPIEPLREHLQSIN